VYRVLLILVTKSQRLCTLDWLAVDENKLTGQIPTELGNLDKVAIFTIEALDLQGTVPDEICALTHESGSLAHFEVDCHITCDCCKECDIGKGCVACYQAFDFSW